MHFRKTTIALGISFAIATLGGCGGSGETTTSSDTQTLSGSVFKGPIDNATIRITDADGNVVASGSSRDGRFRIEIGELPEGPLFIESIGGSYVDEATGEVVVPQVGSGLMNVFTAGELRQAMNDGRFVAMTPETTLLAKLARIELERGATPEEAIARAAELVRQELIEGTTPVPGTAEEVLRFGDLTAPLPASSAEALARNRAISFSYETRNLNLAPEQVFELIETRAEDLEDGRLDGQRDGTPLVLTDQQSQPVALTGRDQRGSFGQARAELLDQTLDRFMEGRISDEERAELERMGINLAPLERLQQRSEEAALQTEANLAADNLPAFRHLAVLSDEDGNPDDDAATYTLIAQAGVDVPVETPAGGWITPMLRYNGSALPPLIRARRGMTITVPVTNQLDEETTVHWHGFKIPADQDGGPEFPIAPGESRTYSFTIDQPAAPLWFHPHPHGRTGEQVYRGLAGLFIVDDEISLQLEADKQLPSGAQDIPLLIQDRRFAEEVDGVRELAYMNHPADQDGQLGDVVLVNGVELPRLDVETRHYRLRLYNASNARTLDIALSDGSTFHVVGTDGGLLAEPFETDHITLGAAERAEIVIDFGRYQVGDRVMLISRAFNGSPMMAMGNGGMGMGNGGAMGTMPRMANTGATTPVMAGAPDGAGTGTPVMTGTPTDGTTPVMTGTPADGTTPVMAGAPDGAGTGTPVMTGTPADGTSPVMAGAPDGAGTGTPVMTGTPADGTTPVMAGAPDGAGTGTPVMTGMPADGTTPVMAGAPDGAGTGTPVMTGTPADGATMPADGTTTGAMGGNAGAGPIMANGQRFDIMRFDITAEATDDITLYTRLPEQAEIHTRLTESDADRERQFIMSMGMGDGGMTFLINGKRFDMNRVDEVVEAGATEIWTIVNRSPMAHPFHAHAIQWQVLDRNGQPATGTDLGWKDTVLVEPGETVRFIGRFDPAVNYGKYMYHCHILEHEDAGMMGTFEVLQ